MNRKTQAILIDGLINRQEEYIRGSCTEEGQQY